MDQRLNFVTLAVTDVDQSGQFYRRLGWVSELDVPGEVMFFKISPTMVLSLWDRQEFETEVGPAADPATAPITLAHNVSSPAEVDGVLAEAEAAGAKILHAGTTREWGGYSGYFADLDGYRYEVAYNPGPIGQSLLNAATSFVER